MTNQMTFWLGCIKKVHPDVYKDIPVHVKSQMLNTTLHMGKPTELGNDVTVHYRPQWGYLELNYTNDKGVKRSYGMDTKKLQELASVGKKDLDKK